MSHQIWMQFGRRTLASMAMIAGCGAFAQAAEQVVTAEDAWRTYTSKEYRFSMKIPRKTTVSLLKSSGFKGLDTRLVFGIYELSDSPTLRAGQFWIEVFIFDHRKGSKLWKSCDKLLVNPSTSIIGGRKIYRGAPVDVSPDAGGYMAALCMEGSEFDFYLQGAESNPSVPTVTTIMNTFEAY